jgi:signal transduction histidine kinase
LTARGSRLDEAVAGHGLGLAIAADIASQYAGRLTFGRGPHGGLAVTVVLPGTLVAAA